MVVQRSCSRYDIVLRRRHLPDPSMHSVLSDMVACESVVACDLGNVACDSVARLWILLP